jgi:hypothetical protein
MQTSNRFRTLAAIGFITAAVIATACDDGDDSEPTAVPSATIAATQETPVTPTPAATVDPAVTPGPAATIELTADPQQLICDGNTASVVTALVFDEKGVPVADGTEVNFSVVTLGTADPIDTTTTGGKASTTVVALAEQAGVPVNVTSGEAEASIRVDCQ